MASGVPPDCVRAPPARQGPDPPPASGMRRPPRTPKPTPPSAHAPIGCARLSTPSVIHGTLSTIRRIPPPTPVRSHRLPADHSAATPDALSAECAVGAGVRPGPPPCRSSAGEPRNRASPTSDEPHSIATNPPSTHVGESWGRANLGHLDLDVRKDSGGPPMVLACDTEPLRCHRSLRLVSTAALRIRGRLRESRCPPGGA